MRFSEQEQASQLRISTVKAEITRTLLRMGSEMPDLTYVELATALTEVVGRQLMHQRRAEVSETES